MWHKLRQPGRLLALLCILAITAFIVSHLQGLIHIKQPTWFENGSSPYHSESAGDPAKAHSGQAKLTSSNDSMDATYEIYVFPDTYRLEPLEVRERYEFYEVWRNENSMAPLGKSETDGNLHQEFRPLAPGPERFKHPGDYLKQFVVADYSEDSLADDTFVLIKTGAETQWQRMPAHVYTTFTRIKHFAIYSDLPGSIAGHEILNVLEDLPSDVSGSMEFLPHHVYKQLRTGQWGLGPSDLTIEGGWQSDKYKNLPAFYHAYRQKPDAKWYFMMDDDTFVFWENLWSFLKNYNHTEPYYMGTASNMGGLKFAHGGSGIVLSNGAIRKMFSDDHEENKKWLDRWAKKTRVVCCGDYMVADALTDNYTGEKVYLDKVGLDIHRSYGGPFQGQKIESMYFIPGMLGQKVITAHKVNARDFERLYTYERLIRGSEMRLSMAQMYKDFVLPYIEHERENWRILNGNIEHVPEYSNTSEIIEDPSKAPFHDDDKPLWPYRSKEDCKKACELDQECWVWTYSQMRCDHSTFGIVLGEAASRFSKQHNTTNQYTTGWMIDRIRKGRANDNADSLTFDSVTNRYSDTDDTSEGWYYRKLIETGFKPFE